MKVVAAELFALRVPFRMSFRHAGKTRYGSDSIVLRLRADDGTVGFGEAVARPYVTGETVASCLDHMVTVLWPCVSGTRYREIDICADPLDALEPIAESLRHGPTSGVIAWHGARAAFETALIDLLLKRQGLSLAAILKPRRNQVVYSGVIGLGSLAKTMLMASYYRCLGLRHIKLKIAGSDELTRRLRLVRAVIGRHCSLRLDANGAFAPHQAEQALSAAGEYDVACIEQPVPRGDPETLARLQRAIAVPLMADESLVTVDDARRLATAGACDYFNLRLAKCGGVVNTLRICGVAEAAGVRLQLGCQVGETAILSALGRHVAAHLQQVDFVEGSYGPRLLLRDVSEQPVGFGPGGRAPLLGGPGIGVEIDEAVLHRYSQQVLSMAGD